MKIQMPIQFHGSYKVVIRDGEKAAAERCQKLTMRELSPEERSAGAGQAGTPCDPTHLITFYDFGCKRIIQGRLKENLPDRVLFQVGEKEYEFSPFRPVSARA